MSEQRELEQVIADALAEARVLDANGAKFSVERVEYLMSEVRGAAEEWLTWLSETDAALRAGVSALTMRGRFENLRRDGHARQISRNVRQYRACAVPRRASVITAAAKGREAAQAARRRAS